MIRNLNETDIKKLVDMEEEAFGKSLGESYFNNELKNPIAHYLVLEINSSIVGYIGSWFSFGLCEIINFVVEKKSRNLGYGSLLISRLIEDASSKDIETIILDVKETNLMARKFYSRFEFNQISIRRKYYDGNIDAINLQKKLVK